MRNVVLQMWMTLDGFVAGPNGELDWAFAASDKITQDYVTDLLENSDVILLGRGMSKEFLDYWPKHGDNNEAGGGFGARINKLPKIVFSTNPGKPEWPDVEIVNDVADKISKLKSERGKNLILYGGAGMVQSFINLNLIDEYHLMVVPVILGKGLPLFANMHASTKLNLVKTTTGTKGAVILHYEPVR